MKLSGTFCLSVLVCFSLLGEGALCEEKVRVGLLPLVSSAPIFVAMEEGLFEKEGVRVELKFLQAAQPIATAMAAGEIDIGATGLTAGLYNAIASGLDAKIVADKGREWPGYKLSGIVVNKGEWEKGLRGIKDLAGRRIGITQMGSTFHYMLGNIMEKHSMSLTQVKLVPLGGLKALAEALAGGQLEAIFVAQPFCTQAETSGAGKVILWAGEELRYQIAAIFMSGSLIKKRDLAKAFLRAYIKGCRIYHDECLGRDSQDRPIRGPELSRVLGHIAKYTGLRPEQILLDLSYNDRNGELMWEDISRQIQWYRRNGMISKELDPENVVDRSLWEEALKEVGP